MSARQRRRPVEPSPELMQRVAGSLDLHIARVPLGELHSATRNARTHTKKQVAQIAASIAKFGFNNPVLVDDDNRLIAGHGRVAAAKLLGITEVPTIRLSQLSEAERRAYALAENRLAELAGWDEELLTVELLELQDLDLDFDLEITGFDLIDIDRMEERIKGAKAVPEDDCVPEPEAQAVSKVGTYWSLKGHDIYLIDVVRGKFEVPDLRLHIERLTLDNDIDVTLIEKTDIGHAILQEMRRSSRVLPILSTPQYDKEARLLAQTPKFEAGQVLFPRETPWLAELVRELVEFPNGAHDDQVDSISQALKYLSRKIPTPREVDRQAARAARRRPLWNGGA